MSVQKHRVVALAILATGTMILLAWGRSMAHDSGEVQAVRDRLRGTWVATLAQAGDKLAMQGPEASATRVEFDGKRVVFRNMIEGGDARGTYLVDPASNPPRIDFKLVEGWVVGLYELTPDTLTLAVNPLALPERLGVPTRYRPKFVGVGKDHNRYVLRKVGP